MKVGLAAAPDTSWHAVNVVGGAAVQLTQLGRTVFNSSVLASLCLNEVCSSFSLASFRCLFDTIYGRVTVISFQVISS